MPGTLAQIILSPGISFQLAFACYPNPSHPPIAKPSPTSTWDLLQLFWPTLNHLLKKNYFLNFSHIYCLYNLSWLFSYIQPWNVTSVSCWLRFIFQLTVNFWRKIIRSCLLFAYLLILRCYGLNVRVPSKFICWILIPNVAIFACSKLMKVEPPWMGFVPL